jgi:hypothetical protein
VVQSFLLISLSISELAFSISTHSISLSELQICQMQEQETFPFPWDLKHEKKNLFSCPERKGKKGKENSSDQNRDSFLTD